MADCRAIAQATPPVFVRPPAVQLKHRPPDGAGCGVRQRELLPHSGGGVCREQPPAIRAAVAKLARAVAAPTVGRSEEGRGGRQGWQRRGYHRCAGNATCSLCANGHCGPGQPRRSSCWGQPAAGRVVAKLSKSVAAPAVQRATESGGAGGGRAQCQGGPVCGVVDKHWKQRGQCRTTPNLPLPIHALRQWNSPRMNCLPPNAAARRSTTTTSTARRSPNTTGSRRCGPHSCGGRLWQLLSTTRQSAAV